MSLEQNVADVSARTEAEMAEREEASHTREIKAEDAKASSTFAIDIQRLFWKSENASL